MLWQDTLDENGAGNIDAPEAGFYMMEVDLTAMTYKHTLISTLGVIGSATPIRMGCRYRHDLQRRRWKLESDHQPNGW